MTGSDLSEDAVRQFRAAGATSGFGDGCPPMPDCFGYVITLRGTLIETWESPATVAEFLGAIDTEEDALFLALAPEYSWLPLEDTAMIRPVRDGYELVLFRYGLCPADVYRVHLHISTEAVLREQNVEPWREVDGCV